MVFLTFGTGLGAGLIIDGRLYGGTNGMAGEVGHIRLDDDGPEGYGKVGSFEGYCSGGGIAQLARERATAALSEGKTAFSCENTEQINTLTTQKIAELALRGDADAIAVFDESARRLGQGLSVLIDILNPEAIVIGSVYARCEELFSDGMRTLLERETLPHSLAVCKILPAALGERIGDIAALSVAMENRKENSVNYVDNLIEGYPELADIKTDINAAVAAVADTYRAGGKILLCGNGGSAADCEHVAGELLKGFIQRREPRGEELSALTAALGGKAASLQQGIAAIPLPSISGAVSAFANDVAPSLVFAQMVYALGRGGDLLIAFSTSGNSENVVNAVNCARALGIKTLSLTGAGGGSLAGISDICIRVPETQTYKIQEYHLPVYHAICAEVERILFS